MDNFDPIGEEQPIQNKSNKLVLAIIAVLVVVAVVVGIVMMSNNNPKAIFETAIDEVFKYADFEDYETVKANMDLEIEIDGEDEISKLINDAKLSLGVESSEATQAQVVTLKLAKAEDELVDAKVKLDSETKKAYVDLGEFFNKTLEVDISETLENSEEADSEPLTFMQTLNAKKAKSILQKEIKNQLKDEYFSSEKVTVDDKNLTKNTMKISEKDLAEILTNICKNLSENKDFTDCFEKPEDVKTALEDAISSIEEEEFDEDSYMGISVYTKGIFKTVERVDVVVDENGEKLTYELTKISDEEISYKVLGDDEQTLEGTIKILAEDDTYNIEISAEQDGEKIVIKTLTSVIYDEELTQVDTSNSVNVEELSDADMMAIYGNFMGSKLYEVIEDVSGSFSGLSNAAGDEDYDYSNDGTEVVEEEETTEKASTTEDNKLITYNDDVVKFNIPDGFDIYSSDSDGYKLFEKEVDNESIDVDVSIEYDTMDEYLEGVNKSVDYFTADYYSNVEVSKPEDIEVKGNKFKKVVVSYDYKLWDDEIEKRQEVYYAHEIDDENLYTVEIDGIEYMTDSEIETFLTIEK